MKNFSREVLYETRLADFNPVNGLKRALEARRQAIEVKRYGTSEERQTAYSTLRAALAIFFDSNPDKVGQSRRDTSGSQISFDWLGLGHGTIDRVNETFTVHIITNPYDDGDTIWGERFRRKNSLIEVNNEGGTATEWVTTSTQPPIDRAIPFVTETKAKTVSLAAQEALDFASIFDTEYIVPTFDSLPIDKDPRYQTWHKY